MTEPEPLSPVDIETRIRAIATRIAKGVTICSHSYAEYLEADRVYELAYARAYMAHVGPSHEKRYAAVMETDRERRARDQADVAYRYADRTAKALEAELRAYQSVGASIRAAYNVAGRGEH